MTIFQRLRGALVGLGIIILGFIMIIGGDSVIGLIIGILG